MATSRFDVSLEMLQRMIDEVLIQTGKSIRQCSDGGQAGQASIGSTLTKRMPEIMEKTHYALDDIELEIMRAKAILLRDYQKLQAERPIPAVPSPMVQEPKDFLFSDLESPKEPLGPPSLVPVSSKASNTQTVAPFPDMDVGGSDTPPKAPENNSSSMQLDETAALIPVPNEAGTTVPMVAGGHLSPRDAASTSLDASMDQLFGLPQTQTNPVDITNVALNFTDMEFTLAPSGTKDGPEAQSQASDFDLSAFAAADIDHNMLSLDNLLPQETSVQQPELLTSAVTDNRKAESQEANNQQTINNQADDDLYDLSLDPTVNHDLELDTSPGAELGDMNNFDSMFGYEENGQSGELAGLEGDKYNDQFFGID